MRPLRQFPPARSYRKFVRHQEPVPNLRATWNMAPTMDAPVVHLNPQTGQRHLDPLRWCLIPSFSKDLKSPRRPINTRSETVATTGMFKDAFERRRCLVAADALYEWRVDSAGKVPFAIARVDRLPLAFAGICEGWRDPEGEILRTFAIITTQANRTMSTLHKRMPVILENASWSGWLGEAEANPTALPLPANEGVLLFWPVSRAVGNARNDGPQLLEAHLPPEHADSSDPPGLDPA